MANKKYYTGKSKIQGKGAFAKKSLKPGDLIGKVHTINQPYVDYEFTELGRNHNHSENPNVQNVLIGNERHLVATKPIKKGQELTSNYRLQPDLEQPEDFKKGGWLDKYSPETAQNGIEGTMGGLTDKGFNYNGAWGGQFAMGGSLPGSVGFTYARTNSPAPSEGPYAKKTMPSAQEGIVTDPVKPALEDMIDFYGSRPEELQIPEMEESLRRLRFKAKSPEFMERYQDGAMGYYNPIGNVIGYNTDPRLIDFEGGVEETLKHEIGHRAYKKLPRSMKKIVRESRIPAREISENLNIDRPFAEYIRGGTEFYTRRRPVYEAFGLDPSAPISKEQAKKLADFSGAMRSINKKDKTPEEAYIEFKNKFPEQLEMLDKLNEYPNRREVMHFMNTIKADPDTFLKMFNDVTAVPGETVPMAQNGMTYYQHGLDWKPKTISRNGGWLDKYVPKAQDGKDYKKEVTDVLSNLPIYSPDARYPEYRGNVQDWTRNLEGVRVEDNPNLSDVVGFQTSGSYFDSDTPSPYRTFPYAKSVQLNPSGFTPLDNRGRVTRHELTHGAFDGNKYVPTWLADNLYNTARNKEQFDRGEHYNLMSERAPMIMGTRKEILDYAGLPLDAKIPRDVYDSYMRGLMETSLRTGDLFVTPNEVAESLQGSRNATDLYNLVNMENIPQRKGGGLVKAQNGFNYQMPRAASESTSAGAIDRRMSANYAAQKGNEVENFIRDYQKKYPGMSREKAMNAFNMSKQAVQNQGQVKKAAPKRSAASKALAIATNPMTALQYKVKGQDIPENFDRGERNRLDMAVDVINPFGVVDAAASIPGNLSRGEFTQAGLNALSIFPSLAELRGLKGPAKKALANSMKSGVFSRPIGGIFSKNKDVPDWLVEEMRFANLPELNNPQASEVLENFMTRIKTPEGQRRLKALGITDTDFFDKLKIVADENTLAQYWQNKIGLHPRLPEVKSVTRHEIEHAVQDARNASLMNKYGKDASNLKYFFRPKKAMLAKEEALRPTTDIDELLKGLELRKTPENVDWKSIETKDKRDPSDLFNYMLDKQRATNYFDSGSEGAEKSAFLGEVQQYMMDKGIIPKTSYTEITPKMVENAFVDAKFDETGIGKYLRLFNIIKPTEKNYKLISQGLNRMLGIVPAVGGTAAIMGDDEEVPQQKEGGLVKAQNGGRAPIYTSDPRRLKSYQDSLGLYNRSVQQLEQQRRNEQKLLDDYNKTVHWYNTKEKGRLSHSTSKMTPEQKKYNVDKSTGISPTESQVYLAVTDDNAGHQQQAINMFPKPVQQVVYKSQQKPRSGEWKPLKPFTGVIENSKPKSKPEPKLKKKVSQVSKLPMGEPSQEMKITERQLPAINSQVKPRQEKTEFAFTYTPGGGNEQKTIYYPTYDAWKEAIDMANTGKPGYNPDMVQTTVKGDRSSAQALLQGTPQFYGGGMILPKAQGGLFVPPTSSDSLNLYNRASEIRNYYQSRGYKKMPPPTIEDVRKKYEETTKNILNEKSTSKKQKKELVKSNKEFFDTEFKTVKEYEKNLKERKFPGYLKDLEESRKTFRNVGGPDAYVDKKGKVYDKYDKKRGPYKPFDNKNFYNPIDENQFEQREGSFGFLDTRSPMPLYDRRIVPQNHFTLMSPGNAQYSDLVQLYEYDPLAVKPYELRTPEEKIKWESLYGKDKTPKQVNSKPVQQVEPKSKLEEIASVTAPQVKPKPEKTQFAFTYTPGGGNKQETIYYPTYEEWREAIDKANAAKPGYNPGMVQTTVSGDRSSAQALLQGTPQFLKGGLVKSKQTKKVNQKPSGSWLDGYK